MIFRDYKFHCQEPAIDNSIAGSFYLANPIYAT